jgi:hypothetical protein
MRRWIQNFADVLTRHLARKLLRWVVRIHGPDRAATGAICVVCKTLWPCGEAASAILRLRELDDA